MNETQFDGRENAHLMTLRYSNLGEDHLQEAVERSVVPKVLEVTFQQPPATITRRSSHRRVRPKLRVINGAPKGTILELFWPVLYRLCIGLSALLDYQIRRPLFSNNLIEPALKVSMNAARQHATFCTIVSDFQQKLNSTIEPVGDPSSRGRSEGHRC
jgi:hypothetical protein